MNPHLAKEKKEVVIKEMSESDVLSVSEDSF